jgi:hypothetical protein
MWEDSSRYLFTDLGRDEATGEEVRQFMRTWADGESPSKNVKAHKLWRVDDAAKEKSLAEAFPDTEKYVRVAKKSKPKPTLACVGKDGKERTFFYSYEPAELDGPHMFWVETDPLPASKNRFEMGFSDLNPDTVRITIADHHKEPAYASMGIPEALIPVAAAVLQKNVQSSPGTADETDVYRVKEATAYWKRTKGATYDEKTDIYTYPKPEPPAEDAGHESKG